MKGLGVRYYENGIIKQGHFLRNQLSQGYGQTKDPKLFHEIKGFFVDDKIEGYGIEKIRNMEYRGCFKNGLKNGLGTLFNESNCLFTGYWIKNQKQGYCEFENDEGIRFKGFIKDDQRNGLGEHFSLEGGFNQLGNFKNGKMEDFGREEYEGSSIYVGGWKKGLKNGLGFYRDHKKMYSYFGSWQRGKRNGIGYEIKGKMEIKGTFYDDQYHGIMAVSKNNSPVKLIEFQNGMVKNYAQNPEQVDSLKGSAINTNKFLLSAQIKLENIRLQLNHESESLKLKLKEQEYDKYIDIMQKLSVKIECLITYSAINKKRISKIYDYIFDQYLELPNSKERNFPQLEIEWSEEEKEDDMDVLMKVVTKIPKLDFSPNIIFRGSQFYLPVKEMEEKDLKDIRNHLIAEEDTSSAIISFKYQKPNISIDDDIYAQKIFELDSIVNDDPRKQIEEHNPVDKEINIQKYLNILDKQKVIRLEKSGIFPKIENQEIKFDGFKVSRNQIDSLEDVLKEQKEKIWGQETQLNHLSSQNK